VKNLENIILVLGDSTSTSLGMNKQTHHMILAERNIWPRSTKIINCSLPGMTAADGLALYRNLPIKTKKSIKVVFLYFGNCDSISMEYPKGKYTLLKHISYRLLNKFKPRKKKKLKNKLLYFEWNKHIDLNRERPEKPLNFKFNLIKIISLAKTYNSKIILIRNKANASFLPGIAKGNFLFYKYINVDDKISNEIKIEDKRFKEALFYQEKKKFKEAIIIYKRILEEPFHNKLGKSYPLMVLNNYAVCLYEMGEYDEAKYLLKLLIKEKNSRQEIAYYNLSIIEKKLSNLENSEKYLQKSLLLDSYMYRIRLPYQEVIDDIIKKTHDIYSIDLNDKDFDDQFLDHCHLLPEGQIILADKAQSIYNAIGLKGNYKSKTENHLYNPDIANGIHAKFYEYFNVKSEVDPKVINEQFKRYFENSKGRDLEIYELNQLNIKEEIQNSFKYFMNHPIFTFFSDFNTIEFIQSDIGRFPETFHFRFLAFYIKHIEQNFNSLIDSYNIDNVLIHSSASFEKIYLELCGDSTLPPLIVKSFSKERVSRIISKIEKSLHEHLTNGTNPYNRIKSIIFWYVRESIRFGSNSRHSMFYNRVQLENIAEALLLADFFNQKHQYGLDQSLSKLKTQLLKCVLVHKKYSKLINLKVSQVNELRQYKNELSNVYKQS